MEVTAFIKPQATPTTHLRSVRDVERESTKIKKVREIKKLRDSIAWFCDCATL